MIKFAEGTAVPGAPESQQSPDGRGQEFGGRMAQVDLHNRIENLVPQMANTPGYGDAQREVSAALPVPERRMSLPLPVTVPDAPIHMEAAHSAYTIRPKQVAKGLALSGATYGGAYAGLVSGSTLYAGGLGAWPIAAAAGVGSLIGGAMTGASLYSGGLLHNMLWHKEGKSSPGTFGTMARGVISPISVPIGLIRAAFKK